MLLLFGLILTLIGALVASRLQQRAWERQYRISIEDTQLQRAQKLADNIAKSCDDRLHFQKQFYLSVKYKDRYDRDLALKNYRKALERWNKRFNYMRSNIFSLYGYQELLSFERLLQEDFAAIGSDIETAYRTDAPLDPAIDSRLTQLSVKIFQYVYRLQEPINDRMMSNFKDIYSVNFSNVDHLDSMYLIKRLYGISAQKTRI